MYTNYAYIQLAIAKILFYILAVDSGGGGAIIVVVVVSPKILEHDD